MEGYPLSTERVLYGGPGWLRGGGFLLEVKMIEFLAEWMVTLLMPASHVLEVRAPHLSFMMLKEYWFRELYLPGGSNGVLWTSFLFLATSRCLL